MITNECSYTCLQKTSKYIKTVEGFWPNISEKPFSEKYIYECCHASRYRQTKISKTIQVIWTFFSWLQYHISSGMYLLWERKKILGSIRNVLTTNNLTCFPEISDFPFWRCYFLCQTKLRTTCKGTNSLKKDMWYHPCLIQL